MWDFNLVDFKLKYVKQNVETVTSTGDFTCSRMFSLLPKRDSCPLMSCYLRKSGNRSNKVESFSDKTFYKCLKECYEINRIDKKASKIDI